MWDQSGQQLWDGGAGKRYILGGTAQLREKGYSPSRWLADEHEQQEDHAALADAVCRAAASESAKAVKYQREEQHRLKVSERNMHHGRGRRHVRLPSTRSFVGVQHSTGDYGRAYRDRWA